MKNIIPMDVVLSWTEVSNWVAKHYELAYPGFPNRCTHFRGLKIWTVLCNKYLVQRQDMSRLATMMSWRLACQEKLLMSARSFIVQLSTKPIILDLYFAYILCLKVQRLQTAILGISVGTYLWCRIQCTIWLRHSPKGLKKSQFFYHPCTLI